MSEDADLLRDVERARNRRRDRKIHGPKVVVDNAGLKKVTLDLARKRREGRRLPR